MTNIQIRDSSLYVKVIGQGYPLVLMHGGPALDHTTLLPFQALADQFTLIFYDHRCNGRSVGADVSSMTFENLTADADALRQTLGFDQWAVLGHSFGGYVALEYALRFPRSISHLLLLDTCGDIRWVQQNAPEIVAKRGCGAEAAQAVHRFFRGQLEPKEFLPTIMKFAGAYNYHNSPLALVQSFISSRQMKIRPEACIFAYRHLLTNWNVMDRLGEITVPALVMAGRHDFLFPTESQVMLADRLPNAQLEMIECAGHNPQMERPAPVMEGVGRFLMNALQETEKTALAL